jgi:flagellar motor switch/type III secretory pathway protein FliN
MSDQPEALAIRADAVLREFGPIHDIPLQVAIEVGRMRLRVRDLMKLAPGTG